MTIAFNARYLQEALQNVRADQVAFEFSGPLSPGVHEAGRRPGLRPRHHAGPHAVLTASDPAVPARAGGQRCASITWS